ncbi:MFS transporter [Corynebacterium nuruki]|uniref:MFS transporter n=1 Tax=Corynebacterium nuruki TaxID=1032851 RepID=UPI00024876D6|nr:MFS transporter [Corynebacterium nuruki]
MSETSDTRWSWPLLVTVAALNMVGMTVVIPILPFIVRDHLPDGADLAVWVGLLEAVNALCAFLASPVLGGLSDRYGRRPVIILGAFGAAVGFLIFGFGGGLWALVLGRVIQGVTAGDMPAVYAYLADITPAPQRSRRYGMLGAVCGAGFMVGPALGGLLAVHSTVLPVVVTAAVAATVGATALILLPESLPAGRRTTALRLARVNPVASFRTAFARPGLRGPLVGLVLVAVPFGFFINNYSVVAMDAVHWDAVRVGLLTSGVGVLDIVVQGGLLALLLPRLGERRVILAGGTAQAAGFAAVAVVAGLAHEPWLIVVGTLCIGGGEGMVTATLTGVLSSQVGESEQGWLAGVVEGVQTGVGVVAPLIVGVLYSGVGHAAPYWAGLLLVLSALVVFGRTLPGRSLRTVENTASSSVSPSRPGSSES